MASDYVNNYSRSKHIEVRNMFVREMVESGEVEPFYVNNDDNTADVFTKPLPAPSFTALRTRLGVVKVLETEGCETRVKAEVQKVDML